MNLFDNLINLRILWLDSNQLTVIHSDTFKNLHNLEILSLHSNSLSCIDSQTFRNLVNLKELHLHNNKLKFIHSDTFQSLINLEKINLYSNYLKTIDPKIFKNLSNLKEIYMHNNQFGLESPIQLNQDRLELCIEENVSYVSFKTSEQMFFGENNILDIVRTLINYHVHITTELISNYEISLRSNRISLIEKSTTDAM
jgi:Leucine-rich repeat (LRR) protein